MRIADAFPSTYLKATELEGDTTYTIKGIEMETLGKGEDADTKPVVYFQEVDLGLALNKTNANTISGLYGPETNEWIGKQITLFATEVDFQGKQTLAIRVRMRAPSRPSNAGKPPAPPLHTAGAAATQGGYEAARQAFDAKVAKHNEETPNDAYKEGEANTVFRKIMGELYPGRTSSTLTAAEWGQAREAMVADFDASTRNLLPF
jgi:hypothetical protein